LTEKVGANVSRVYREVGDVATIDRHAQARRLIGAAIADIDALHAATPPTSPDALRDLLHAVLDEGLGAGRVAMRRRRLSALGASFGRADLTALAAVHHVEATHRAVELITPWRDALDLPTHVAASGIWAMGLPIGLAHVDLIAEGHHDDLATFLVDLLHVDLIEPAGGPERPKTLKAAVTHAIRRGDTWRTGPSNATREALVNAAIERAATPGKPLESSALARDVGLTDVAAHYYFANLGSLVDEAAMTAGQRALDALRDLTKTDASAVPVQPDAFLDLLLTHQAAIALQRFTSLPRESEGKVAKGAASRTEAWDRFIDGAAAILAPHARGADREHVRSHVRVLLYATQGRHTEAAGQAHGREVDSVREVLSSTLLPALRSVVAKPGDAP